MYRVCSRTTNREAKVQSGKRGESFCSLVRKDLIVYFLLRGAFSSVGRATDF